MLNTHTHTHTHTHKTNNKRAHAHIRTPISIVCLIKNEIIVTIIVQIQY